MAQVARVVLDGSESYKALAGKLLREGYVCIKVDTSELPHELVFCIPFTHEMELQRSNQLYSGILV